MISSPRSVGLFASLATAALTAALTFSSSVQAKEPTIPVYTITCNGDGHSIDLVHDISVNLYGPAVYKIDGQDARPGLKMELGSNFTKYDAKGVSFQIGEGDKKKAFSKVVDFKGKKLKMNCGLKTTTKPFAGAPMDDLSLEDTGDSSEAKTAPAQPAKNLR